ncbi:hypothetical protein [Desulforamulus putei]|uniref:Uncharacterized protein n=1 Tax=Desulforamulus putei DSM 12395 TaxID=1121429 RepID=A0A1M4WYM9_9FIRM|nr:hypothetical protein [Desulforamulus putei]SHE86344.1 hypothetical protein SAMN02745133_01303 [Desulforamulus putei DSM 12395]
MRRNELVEALARNKKEIRRIKHQLLDIENAEERRRMLRKLKVLQQKQVWYYDLLENMENGYPLAN